MDLNQFLTATANTQRFGDYFGGITFGCNAKGYPKRNFIHIENHDANRRLPLHVLFARRDLAIPGVYRATQDRNLLAVEFMIKGETAFRQDGHSFLIKENELMMVQPLCDTAWAPVSKGESEKLSWRSPDPCWRKLLPNSA